MSYVFKAVSDVGIVISRFEGRLVSNSDSLIKQLQSYTRNIIVVTNDDAAVKVDHFSRDGVMYIRRPNLGMNIGAWNEAIKLCHQYRYTLFLQNEVFLINRKFLQIYDEHFANPNVGLVSESLNFGWNDSWDGLRMNEILNYQIHTNGNSGLKRIDFYHNLFRKWAINPGESGLHARALAIGLSREALNALGSFPVGQDKEECIASEIAISRKIISLGLKMAQSAKVPFSCFIHPEWEWSGIKKRY